MIHITDNERKVLTSLQHNDYEDGTWSWAINNSSKPSGIEGPALSGVVSSLVKKGLVTSDEYDHGENVICITQAGKDLGFDFMKI